MVKNIDIRCYKVYVDDLHYLTYWDMDEAIAAAEQYGKNPARTVRVVAVMEVGIWNGQTRRE